MQLLETHVEATADAKSATGHAGKAGGDHHAGRDPKDKTDSQPHSLGDASTAGGGQHAGRDPKDKTDSEPLPLEDASKAPKEADGDHAGKDPKEAEGDHAEDIPESPEAYFNQIVKPKLLNSPVNMHDYLLQWGPVRWSTLRGGAFPNYDNLRVHARLIGVTYGTGGTTVLHGLAESRPKEGVRVMLKRTDLKSQKTNQMGSMVFKSRDEEKQEYPKEAYLYLEALQLLMLVCRWVESKPEEIRDYHAKLKKYLESSSPMPLTSS